MEDLEPWKKQQTILCDIDGTLALRQDRSPYNFEKADTDLVNEPVVLVLELLSEVWFKIIFLTGRDEKYREITENWLNINLPPELIENYTLLMRPRGDTRSDEIVKQEIYERELKPKYNVYLILDDRPRVIKMWKSLGLRVWNVKGTCEEF